MEGGDGDAAGGVADLGGEALAELVPRAAGEGDGEAALGRQASVNAMRDRVREHTGLSCTGTSHDDQRAAVVSHDGLLVLVEGGGRPVRRGHGRQRRRGRRRRSRRGRGGTARLSRRGEVEQRGSG